LVSLDARLFEDGATTLGDTITRGFRGLDTKAAREGSAFRQITGPLLTFREQVVGRFVQTLLLTARIRQMSNQVAIQLVNVRPLKIVKLLTFEAEDRVARDHADMDAFAVEYIAVHDRPPIEAPHGKGCACRVAIVRQIALGLFPLRLQPQPRLATTIFSRRIQKPADRELGGI
jgi:hypothetical protein